MFGEKFIQRITNAANRTTDERVVLAGLVVAGLGIAGLAEGLGFVTALEAVTDPIAVTGLGVAATGTAVGAAVLGMDVIGQVRHR